MFKRVETMMKKTILIIILSLISYKFTHAAQTIYTPKNDLNWQGFDFHYVFFFRMVKKHLEKFLTKEWKNRLISLKLAMNQELNLQRIYKISFRQNVIILQMLKNFWQYICSTIQSFYNRKMQNQFSFNIGNI